MKIKKKMSKKLRRFESIVNVVLDHLIKIFYELNMKVIMIEMRVLYIHAKEFRYKPIKKAKLNRVEESGNELKKYKDILVAFITVECGDFQRRKEIVHNMMDDLKIHLERLNTNRLLIYPYAHLSDNLEDSMKAIRMLKFIDVMIKKMMPNLDYERAPFGWYKEFLIHCLGHPLSELSRKF